MIHKQQMGHTVEDIIAGLCQALVRNYINNLLKGKEILKPISLQGRGGRQSRHGAGL